MRIETLYQDGSLLSVTGSAAHAVQYLYGVDGDGPFTTGIEATETCGTNEWVKTSTDLLGWAYKTTYAAASAPYPFSLSTFNSKGQLTNQVDPDGVITLLAYNPKGEQVYSVLDSNRNYTMDGSGSDQITFTTYDMVADSRKFFLEHGVRPDCAGDRRSRSWQNACKFFMCSTHRCW